LVSSFLQAKRDLAAVIGATRATVQRFQLTPISNQGIGLFKEAFIEKRLYLLDSLIGQVNSSIQDIEGPARKRWPAAACFAKRWEQESTLGRNFASDGRRLLNDLDYHFGRLLEARYSDLTPKEVLSTHHFYPRFIGPRRRGAGGSVEKAIILVIDSMRFDL